VLNEQHIRTYNKNDDIEEIGEKCICDIFIREMTLLNLYETIKHDCIKTEKKY